MSNIIKPKRPNDFFPFWSRTLEELAVQSDDIEIRSERVQESWTLRRMAFSSLVGARLKGYCIQWNDRIARPLLVYTHGYGGHAGTNWKWARAGLNVVGFDTRGFGLSKSAAAVSEDGHILSGIEHQQISILRGAVCDFVRAVDVAKKIISTPVKRLLCYGFSFGGAMAIMAEAVRPAADLLVTGAPSMGWTQGRRQWATQGSTMEINAYLEQYREKEQHVMDVLAYFDTVNFADQLTCPTLIGFGEHDEYVPAATVRAIINVLRCPYNVQVMPYGHSDRPEEVLWETFEQYWLALATTDELPRFTDTISAI